MANKALRILIADERHIYRLQIERMLNYLGYYRVAPMKRLTEVLSIVEDGVYKTDLLIINVAMLKSLEFDLCSICSKSGLVTAILIYGDKSIRMLIISSFQRREVKLSDFYLPNVETLSAMLAKVDIVNVGGYGVDQSLKSMG